MTHRIILLIAVLVPWLNPLSLGPTQSLVQWLASAICMAWVVIVLGSNPSNLNLSLPQPKVWITHGWVVAASVSAVFGLAQYFGVADNFGPLVSHATVGETYANLRQRNQFATLLNLGLAAAIAFTWSIQYFREGRFAPLFAGVCISSALLGVANAASASRTGLLQLLLVAFICFWWTKNANLRQRTDVRLTVLACLLGYLAASIALPLLIGLDPHNIGILSRFRDGGEACQSRLTLWSNVLHLIAQKPWTGWGWGELDYAHFITLYPGARFCDILDNAHNLPLHLAVELGVPVSAAFCAVCIWLIKREKPWREQDPMRKLAWTVLALIGLHSLLEYPLWYGPFQMTVLLCFYILWRTPASWRGTNSLVKPLPPALTQTASALAVAVMVVCAYAAWDYWRISQIYTAPSQRDPAYKDDTLNKIKGSWLFQSQVRFAELNITPLTKDNAEHINALAKEMLHFSPEPQVVRKLIESAVLLARDDEAAFYLQRFHAAFPSDTSFNQTCKLTSAPAGKPLEPCTLGDQKIKVDE